MRIVEIKTQQNGAHRNQSFPGFIPDGWAVVPADMTLDNFPFGEVEVAEVDGITTVTKWTAGVMPEPTPAELTPAQQRELAYNTETVIDWDGGLLTVTQAAQLWQYYAAEGSYKADELQALIFAAKQEIRQQFPEEV